jgi:CRISP-associated protein Cas1
MNTKATFNGRKTTYQTILFSNLQGFAHFVIGRNTALYFDIPELVVKRNDNVDFQQRILSMTPDERRKQGINKSTLWYQKKKLTEGKSVKVYEKVLAKYLG